jgi:hypothetical protein
MERSAIRRTCNASSPFPDYAALHPDCLLPYLPKRPMDARVKPGHDEQ